MTSHARILLSKSYIYIVKITKDIFKERTRVSLIDNHIYANYKRYCASNVPLLGVRLFVSN